MNYKIIITIVSVFFSLNTYASTTQQKGYKIEVSAPSKEGSTAYLANYWQGNTYIIDSIIVPQGGAFAFANTELPLPAGQYLLYIKPDTQMDLLINKEQSDIKIKIDEKNISKSSITGSRDTELFWSYVQDLQKLNENVEKASAVFGDEKSSEESIKEAATMYETALEELNKFSDQHIEKNKGTWFASFIKASKPISAPHTLPKNREEQIENQNYIKKHFFDNVDFSDDRLLRTNFFIPQIDSYLQQWVVQHPDSIAKESSRIVGKTEKGNTVFGEVLSYLMNNSMTSRAMGMENVWAKLYEDYVLDKNVSWIDSTQYNNLAKEYSLLELNRIGMKAQNLELWTLEGDSINTNDIDAEFTVLYFYSTSCTHCSIEIPKLRYEFYETNKEKDVKVIAINLERNTEAWQQFMERNNMNTEGWTNVFDPNFKSEYWLKYDTHATPSLYLLDKEKTIIGKKLNVESLGIYFEQITN